MKYCCGDYYPSTHSHTPAPCSKCKSVKVGHVTGSSTCLQNQLAAVEEVLRVRTDQYLVLSGKYEDLKSSLCSLAHS